MKQGNAHEQLGQALLAFLGNGTIASSRQRNWASATFSGARHSFAIETGLPPAKLDSLSDHEFTLSGHIVADICVVEFRSGSSGCALEVEALTVEEC